MSTLVYRPMHKIHAITACCCASMMQQNIICDKVCDPETPVTTSKAEDKACLLLGSFFSWGLQTHALWRCAAAKLLDLSAWKSTSVHFMATHAIPWRDSRRSWVRDPEAIAGTSGKKILYISHSRTTPKRASRQNHDLTDRPTHPPTFNGRFSSKTTNSARHIYLSTEHYQDR